MDEDQKKVILALTEATMHGIDSVFRVAHSRFADQLDNPDDIYQTFVVVLAQTLGRHIAAFAPEDRDEMAVQALSLQEEMTELVITETAKAELGKAQANKSGTPYDLAKMKPEGNA